MCAQLLQSCPTLCNPTDCSPPGSSVHGILHARILEWVAMPSSKRSSQPRNWADVSGLLHCRQILSCWATGEALIPDSLYLLLSYPILPLPQVNSSFLSVSVGLHYFCYILCFVVFLRFIFQISYFCHIFLHLILFSLSWSFPKLYISAIYFSLTMIYLIYNARSILKLKTTHMLAPMGLVPNSAI